ncbi:MAG: tryptophan synthase subunit alpha [Berryella intestinalis]|nr:tryptophan synthase subunit alpha [Berryella intestinalis]
MTSIETTCAAAPDRALRAAEDRIERALRANGRAFVPYVVAGEPTLEESARLVADAAESGADLIEVGIPFSDPTAEGEVTKQASLRSLARKTSPDDVFELVRSVRATGVSCPIALVSYANVAFSYGTDRFMRACAVAGVDAVVLVDVPLEERAEFCAPAAEHGICMPCVAYPAPEKRLAAIARAAEGFVQLACPPGFPEAQARAAADALRKHASVPVAVAYENAEPSQAGGLAALADGVVVNAAVTELMQAGGLEAARAYLRSAAEGVHAS